MTTVYEVVCRFTDIVQFHTVRWIDRGVDRGLAQAQQIAGCSPSLYVRKGFRT